MGSAASAFNRNTGPAVPEGYVTPPFPSLYLPSFQGVREIGGTYLYDAEQIWRFTLYWTLIIMCGTFGFSALIALISLSRSIMLSRPSASPPSTRPQTPPQPLNASLNPPTPLTPITPHTPSSPLLNGRRVRPKRKRPPLWPLLLLPIGAVFIAAMIALVSATVIGFALAAVYSAGGFVMSTWVPFLWGCIQVVMIIIQSYSTLTKLL